MTADSPTAPAPYKQRTIGIWLQLPWGLLVITLLIGVGLTQYFFSELTRAEKKRQHDLKLACLRVLMWMDVSNRLRGLDAHAFDEWLPLARKKSGENNHIRYEWEIRPEHNEGLSLGWIEVSESGLVINGGTIAAEY